MATATSPPPFSTSPSLSIARSPDTASPLFPERAIRPLPRSRLKAKLSPEQASSIIYPPDPVPASPVLSFGGKENAVPGGNSHGRMSNGLAVHEQYLHHTHHPHHETAMHSHCTCGEEVDSGDEEIEFDHPDFRYASPTPNGTVADTVLDSVQRRLMAAKAAPSASAASSADGYESFENTSNKKKRKIPLSAASSMHQTHLSAEMASLGLNGPLDGAMDAIRDGASAAKGEYYPPTPASSNAGSGTGISGAGRGRYGRQNGRSDHGIRRPLASSSMNSVNGYHPRMPARSSGEMKRASDAEIENTGGIISQAIKSAAEQGSMTPQKGQELVSLLQTATSNDAAPTNSKTQFTFSVESESATKMVDQHAAAIAAFQNPYAGQSGNARGNMNCQVPAPKGSGASSAHSTPSLRQTNGAAQMPAGRQPPNSLPPQQAAQPPPLPAAPKLRRRPSREYAHAARQRRLQQEYSNYHHRPTKDNMWICEFCEYESIFGVQPLALIRQYEIKDRRERKRQEEKRRLLEKAKAKNRKGKKGGKKGGHGNNNANSAAAANVNAAGGAGQQQPYDPNLLPPDGDEYYDDDEYGDEYEPMGPDDQYPADYYSPPPVGVGTTSRDRQGG